MYRIHLDWNAGFTDGFDGPESGRLRFSIAAILRNPIIPAENGRKSPWLDAVKHWTIGSIFIWLRLFWEFYTHTGSL